MDLKTNFIIEKEREKLFFSVLFPFSSEIKEIGINNITLDDFYFNIFPEIKSMVFIDSRRVIKTIAIEFTKAFEEISGKIYFSKEKNGIKIEKEFPINIQIKGEKEQLKILERESEPSIFRLYEDNLITQIMIYLASLFEKYSFDINIYSFPYEKLYWPTALRSIEKRIEFDVFSPFFSDFFEEIFFWIHFQNLLIEAGTKGFLSISVPITGLPLQFIDEKRLKYFTLEKHLFKDQFLEYPLQSIREFKRRIILIIPNFFGFANIIWLGDLINEFLKRANSILLVKEIQEGFKLNFDTLDSGILA